MTWFTLPVVSRDTTSNNLLPLFFFFLALYSSFAFVSKGFDSSVKLPFPKKAMTLLKKEEKPPTKATAEESIPFTRRLFHAVGRIHGTFILRGFDKDASRADEINISTLRNIVLANRDTEWGRKHDFASILEKKSSSDNNNSFFDNFKKAVPLQTYLDIEPLIRRMEDGEENVLAADPPILFALSAGTTGTPKLIPTTSKMQAAHVRYFAGVLPAVASQKIPGGSDPTLGASVLSGSTSGLQTKGGIPKETASSAGMTKMKPIMSFLYVTPYEAAVVRDHDACWYLHALFALRNRNTKFIEATFCSTLVGWLALIEKRWEDLLDDITNGTINRDLNISDAERAGLLQYLRIDPARANELRKSVSPEAGYFDAFVSRAWPNLRYAGTQTTGSFAAYLPRLKRYLGEDLPVFSGAYGASEAMVGVNLWPERGPEDVRYVLSVGCAAYEFIPVEHLHENQPKTYGPSEVQVGREYEVVVTNIAGFYRYRLNDIVRVVDFYKSAPVFQFAYRAGGLLDLVGEKLTEEQTLEAVRSFAQTWAGSKKSLLVDYTAAREVNTNPPRHVFYVELSTGNSNGDDSDVTNDAWKYMHAALLDQHAYKVHFGKNDIGTPIVKMLRAGAFNELVNLRLASSQAAPSRNQIKTSRVITDEKQLALLDSYTYRISKEAGF